MSWSPLIGQELIPLCRAIEGGPPWDVTGIGLRAGRPACRGGHKKGSSRLSGEGRLDFQKKV
ncbi:hypothetical protein, partial [Aeromonas caviae]|uniref:hypothetical protein n=1 Tax=Aeromonas caviae TaxID=648 RepID=UPI0029D877CD